MKKTKSFSTEIVDRNYFANLGNFHSLGKINKTVQMTSIKSNRWGFFPKNNILLLSIKMGMKINCEKYSKYENKRLNILLKIPFD